MGVFEHFPGEKLLTKIWQTLAEKGIGGMLSPWQIKREGKARAQVRRHEQLLQEQTKLDLKEIRAGRKRLDDSGKLIGGKAPETTSNAPIQQLSTAPPDAKALLAYALSEGAIREAERVLTLQQIGVYAEEAGEGTPDDMVSDEDVDPDWFARWRRNAEDANDDLLKRLWAQVLAGEVKQPRSYSFRTLDFLRNLSIDEAKKIQKLGPLLLDGQYIAVGTAAETPGLDMDAFVEFEHLGIIGSRDTEGAIGLNRIQDEDLKSLGANEGSPFSWYLRCNHTVLLVGHRDPSKRLGQPRIGVTRLSQVGREILRLGSFEADMGYLRRISRTFQGSGYTVSSLDRHQGAQTRLFCELPPELKN